MDETVDKNNNKKTILKNAISVEMIQVVQDENQIYTNTNDNNNNDKNSNDHIQTTVMKNVNCGQIICTCSVISMLFLTVLLAIGHFYLFYRYSSNNAQNAFAYINRKFVWVFLLFSILFTLVFTWLICRWKKLTTDWLKNHYFDHSQTRSTTNTTVSVASILKRARQKYNGMFGLNGTHYLHRLYGWEFVENWVQFFNLRNIYLCTLPISLTCTICILLMIECFYRVYTLYKSLFGKIRDSNSSLLISTYSKN